MNAARAIAGLRRELGARIDAAVARLFVWTRTSTTSALGKEDSVETADDSDGQRPVRRTEPWGVRGRPVKGQRALSLRLGSSTVIYLGIASDGGYGPGDLESGETAIYSEQVEKALHATDEGDVHLASSDAVGRLVTINGDTYWLLKTDDFLDDFRDFVNRVLAVISSNCINGAPLTEYPTYAAALAAFATQLGTPGAYRSEKAKNG